MGEPVVTRPRPVAEDVPGLIRAEKARRRRRKVRRTTERVTRAALRPFLYVLALTYVTLHLARREPWAFVLVIAFGSGVIGAIHLLATGRPAHGYTFVALVLATASLFAMLATEDNDPPK